MGLGARMGGGEEIRVGLGLYSRNPESSRWTIPTSGITTTASTAEMHSTYYASYAEAFPERKRRVHLPTATPAGLVRHPRLFLHWSRPRLVLRAFHTRMLLHPTCRRR
jgi:hypothetical protein